MTSDLISHELGHSLGLENDGCVDGIMEDGFSMYNPNLHVTDVEAYQTDQENYTHYEEEGTGKNSQCLPDDLVCQGSPIVLNLTHGPYVLTAAADGVRFKLEPTGEPQPMA